MTKKAVIPTGCWPALLGDEYAAAIACSRKLADEKNSDTSYRFAIVLTFPLRGSYYAIATPLLMALIRIQESLLELRSSLRLEQGRATIDVWRHTAGCLFWNAKSAGGTGARNNKPDLLFCRLATGRLWSHLSPKRMGKAPSVGCLWNDAK